MTRNANGNYFKPIFFLISMRMMIMSRMRSALTSYGNGRWYNSFVDLLINKFPSKNLFLISNPLQCGGQFSFNAFFIFSLIKISIWMCPLSSYIGLPEFAINIFSLCLFTLGAFLISKAIGPSFFRAIVTSQHSFPFFGLPVSFLRFLISFRSVIRNFFHRKPGYDYFSDSSIFLMGVC